MNDLVLPAIDRTPQVITGLPFDDYKRLDAINASALKLIERSPAHYWQSRQTPREATPAQALGTLAHLLILEPEREGEIAIAPDVDRRTKAGKEEWAAFLAESNGRQTATADQFDAARRMRDAVQAQPFARALLAGGEPEVTLLWQQDGTPIKCRLDWLCRSHDVVLDLKTASDASAVEFARASGRYAYHLQAALYTDAAAACGLGERAFVFLVVESEPPHGVALYQLDEDAMRAGSVRYRQALERYRECLARNDWPGYPPEVQPLTLPKWAL